MGKPQNVENDQIHKEEYKESQSFTSNNVTNFLNRKPFCKKCMRCVHKTEINEDVHLIVREDVKTALDILVLYPSIICNNKYME